MGTREVINKYQSLLKDDRYDEIFKRCSEAEARTLLDFLYNQVGINPLEFMTFIPNKFFYGMNIKGVTIPNTITTIGNSAFESSTIQDVYMSDSVVDMGRNVFRGCSELVKIRLSKGLTEIPDGTFANCTNLTKIFIPDAVTFIGRDAFENCNNILIGANFRKDPNNKIQFMKSDIEFYKQHLRFKRV